MTSQRTNVSMATMMTEAQLQRTIMDALELGGWLYSHHPDSRRSAGGGGLPDLVAVHPKRGRLLFIECKSESGRLSKRQELWRRALQDAGAEVCVVCPSMLNVFLEHLLGR